MPESGARTRVLIADDHPIVAEGMRRFLSSIEDIEVVATAGTIDALRVALAHTRRLDVVVLDVQIPGMEGAVTVHTIRAAGAHVVLFTHQAPDDYVARMLHAGAHGYVSKSDPVTSLVSAIRNVRAGGEWLDEELRALRDEGREAAPHEALTGREREVFLLLAKSKSPKEIGYELALAPSTVYAHVEKVRTKLGVASAAELERYAERWGLLRKAER